ncbi:hypothetical protein SETIT_2G221200v2 [Setaria italica]|uniref:Uncharacterized protein n=1 Tax=Setaria italica TaxID=4555 RepID=A0A368Q2H5_SETIT|nr:hypothetical protein SETIT_2G221200v2 [Setaria italica]
MKKPRPHPGNGVILAQPLHQVRPPTPLVDARASSPIESLLVPMSPIQPESDEEEEVKIDSSTAEPPTPSESSTSSFSSGTRHSATRSVAASGSHDSEEEEDPESSGIFFTLEDTKVASFRLNASNDSKLIGG